MGLPRFLKNGIKKETAIESLIHDLGLKNKIEWGKILFAPEDVILKSLQQHVKIFR